MTGREKVRATVVEMLDLSGQNASGPVMDSVRVLSKAA
jgi:hypothetical protein